MKERKKYRYCEASKEKKIVQTWLQTNLKSEQKFIPNHDKTTPYHDKTTPTHDKHTPYHDKTTTPTLFASSLKNIK